MKEADRIDVQKAEQALGICFVESRQDLLDQLDEQIAKLADNLGVQPYRLEIPARGFLSNPLSPEQDKQVNQLIGPQYADSAVELQDRLTVIPIKEGGEKMISLPLLFSENNVPLSLSEIPFHEACGQWAGKKRIFWVREGVAGRILKAAQALETLDIALHIEDAFRPMGVQEGLFYRRVGMILQQHPEWANEWDKVWLEARSKTAVSPWMAGHKSGAALDITLRRKTDRQPLPLGNTYPEGGPKVAIHYPYVTQEEWSTRQLFAATMEMAGLGIYPYENWHASFGDLSAGISAISHSETNPNYTAMYGPIKGFNIETGEVDPYPAEEYFASFFTREELLRSLNPNTQ